MSTTLRECPCTFDTSGHPMVLVSDAVAALHNVTPDAFARELRTKHVALLESLPPAVFEQHNHLLPLETGGVRWLFAIVQLEVRGQRGHVLVAFLFDERDALTDAVDQVTRHLTAGARGYVQ